ncbi:MAG: MotR [Nitrosomonadales bacterium]|nr:MotR [Nitrosomonadales bacterium]
MANLYDNYDDQADGLRRIMAGPQPRVFSVLSAIDGMDKSRILANLAVSLLRNGSEVLVINADAQQSMQSYGASGLSTLSALAVAQAGLKGTIKRVSQGFSVANLMTIKQLRQGMTQDMQGALNDLVTDLANQYDVLLVDAELTAEDTLPLAVLNEGEIVIQLNNHPDAIKQAYRLIKQVYNQLGCRSFGILVTDVQPAEAERVFNHLSQVARRYLSVRLDFMGAIPPDEYLNKASKLGRAVVEAFPMALASAAFKDLAKRLDFGRDAYAAG